MWEHAKKKKKRHFSTAGCIRRLYYLMICLSLSLIVCSIWKSFCTFQLFLIAWFPASYCFTTSDQPSMTSNLLSAVVVTLCAPFYSFSNSHSASLKNLQPPSPPMPPPAAPPPAQFTRGRLQGSALYWEQDFFGIPKAALVKTGLTAAAAGLGRVEAWDSDRWDSCVATWENAARSDSSAAPLPPHACTGEAAVTGKGKPLTSAASWRNLVTNRYSDRRDESLALGDAVRRWVFSDLLCSTEVWDVAGVRCINLCNFFFFFWELNPQKQ